MGSKRIGIDLGTTNSVVAVMEGGRPVVIPNAQGGRTTPSVVAFKGDERLVGILARNQAITNPQNTLFSIKRFMGRKAAAVQEETSQVPYAVVAGSDGRAEVAVGGEQRTPEEISAMILSKLKADAETYLGETVDDAVITVPAYFDDVQRTATRDAARIAGFASVRILNEPTAAALAYGLGGEGDGGHVLVFDLGGGTFDVSVLEINDGTFEVKATSGDTHLGGDDYNKCIADWLADGFLAEHGIDLRTNPQSLQRLTEAAEKAKIELSEMTRTTINLPFITADASGPKNLEAELSRTQFEELTRELTERCRLPFQQVLEDAGLTAADLNEVILVGGSTRMPAIQRLVSELSGGKEPHRGINPDEVVAAGAAVQGGIMQGEVKGALLIDVIPLTLGIETKGGIAKPMIARNSRIPCKVVQQFATMSDNQQSVGIHVVQGESELAARNRSLGFYTLSGITPAPAARAYVEVAYAVDADGIVSVSAKEIDELGQPIPGKPPLQTTVTGSTSLSEDEVNQAIHEAEQYSEVDRGRVAAIELRNQAESLVREVPRWIEENTAVLSTADHAALAAGVESLTQALQGEDPERLREVAQDLIRRIGELQEPAAGAPDAHQTVEADPLEGM